MSKKIVWEKWDDPLAELTNDDGSGSDSTKRILLTKFGALTISDKTLASKHFDTWMVHTNFVVNEAVGDKVIHSKGVNFFLPSTRYSFVVGFPTSGLFDITECKLILTKTLTMEENIPLELIINDKVSEELMNAVQEKIEELRNSGGLWCIYILPNGNYEVAKSEVVTEVFNDKVKIFKDTQKLVGGQLYSNVNTE